MRIIGGKLKGRLIKFVKSSTTRPLKDSVKENIFNIIIHTNKFSVNLFNSNVLDVFSGIGSFGIECISRGAKKVTFIEKNFDISNVLKSNLINLSLTNNSKLVNAYLILLNDKVTPLPIENVHEPTEQDRINIKKLSIYLFIH